MLLLMLLLLFPLSCIAIAAGGDGGGGQAPYFTVDGGYPGRGRRAIWERACGRCRPPRTGSCPFWSMHNRSSSGTGRGVQDADAVDCRRPTISQVTGRGPIGCPEYRIDCRSLSHGPDERAALVLLADASTPDLLVVKSAWTFASVFIRCGTDGKWRTSDRSAQQLHRPICSVIEPKDFEERDDEDDHAERLIDAADLNELDELDRGSGEEEDIR